MIVIDKGTIAEMGTHDELIQQNGVYKRLILRQLTVGSVDETSRKNLNSGGSGATEVFQEPKGNIQT